MADVSTTEILLVAVAGGLAGQLLATLARTVEFHREDRARWIRERRDSYAAYIDGVGAMLAESAPLESYLEVLRDFTTASGEEPDDLLRRTRECADLAYGCWVKALKHLDVLRLLASRKGLNALDQLNGLALELVRSLTATSVGGRGDPDSYRTQRHDVQEALDKLIGVARRDIGA